MAKSTPSPPVDAFKLYPPPTLRLEPADIHGRLVLPEGAAGGKPYTVINAVATLDGKAALEGRSSPIGSALDRLIMRNLRCAVDGVLVGTGTLRAEDLELGVPQELVERRRENGLDDQPLWIILMGNSPLPKQRRLYRQPHGNKDVKLLVLGPPGAQSETIPKRATFRALSAGATEGRPEPREVLEILAEKFGVRRLLVEGGPTVNYSFLSGGHVEELFLTLAPKISGESSAPTIVAGAAALPSGEQDARLLSAHTAGGELYLRYRL